MDGTNLLTLETLYIIPLDTLRLLLPIEDGTQNRVQNRALRCMLYSSTSEVFIHIKHVIIQTSI